MKTKTWAVCGVLFALSVGLVAVADPPQKPQEPDTLEGTLRVHPKYLFKYYIDGFGDGQKCALRPNARFDDIKPGTPIRVRGTLRTKHHPGTTPENLSPFPRTWYIEMDVKDVTVLKPKASPPQTAP